MTGHRRPKSVRKSRSLALSRQERSYSKDPHSFIFTRPGVGQFVKQLSMDLRSVFEPFTATRMKVTKRNVLKDFVAVAGPLHVTHFLYLTHLNAEKRVAKHTKQLSKKVDHPSLNFQSTSSDHPQLSTDSSYGGVYLHLLRVPHGPSLTFSVSEYSLQRDVLTLVRRIFDSHQYATPPLLAMTGFGSLVPGSSGADQQPPPPHLRLIVDMFQHMLPSLNVQKVKLNTVRRVLLISREVDLSTVSDGDKIVGPDDVIYIRHYHIRTENREISRALRRLQLGRASKKRASSSIVTGLGPGGSGKSSGVPNLSKYTCMEDYLTKAGMLSDSGLSDALSDMEEVDLPTAQLNPITTATNSVRPLKRSKPSSVHGLRHMGAAKRATVRLTEIGPRLTLKLIKIEEGLNTGTVLYHRWQSRTLVQVADQAERLRQREALRAARRAEHEAGREANEASREAHRQACLDGMRRAGHLPPATSNNETDVQDSSAEQSIPSISNGAQVRFTDQLCLDDDEQANERKANISGAFIGKRKRGVKRMRKQT